MIFLGNNQQLLIRLFLFVLFFKNYLKDIEIYHISGDNGSDRIFKVSSSGSQNLLIEQSWKKYKRVLVIHTIKTKFISYF